MLWSIFGRISSVRVCVQTGARAFHLSPSFTLPLKNIFACAVTFNSYTFVPQPYLNSVPEGSFTAVEENWFCLRNKSALFFLPRRQRLAAAGDKVLSPGERAPWQHRETPSVCSMFRTLFSGLSLFGDGRHFPTSQRWGDISGFQLSSTRVGGNPPRDPWSHPVTLPAGSLPAESCFMLLITNIQTNWSLWSWHRILDRRIIVCFTSLY